MAGLNLDLNNYQAFAGQLRNLDQILTNLDRRIDRAATLFDKLEGSVSKIARSEADKKIDSLSSAVRELADNSTRAQVVLSQVERAIDRIDSAAGRTAPRVRTLVTNLGEGLQVARLDALFEREGAEAAKAFLDGLTTVWQIRSPSRVMQSIAGFLGDGFKAGLRALGMDSLGRQTGDDFVDGFANEVQKAPGALGGFKSALAAALPAVTAGALLLGSFTAAKDFESAFAGVRKTLDTTGLSAQETTIFLEQLEDDLRNLATAPDSVVAGIDNAQIKLAGIAEAAGQLGIARGDILEFTDTIAQLELTTDLVGEAGATMLAQFANITGTREFDRLGAAIVALGNNGASTESQIVEFAQRLAGAGKLAGLTDQQILALSSTMASLGLNAEAGGTAATQVLNKITTAVADGGSELEAFARIAGESAGDFANVWRTNPIEALQEFIVGLSQLDNEEAVRTLDALGLDGIRVSDTLRRMSSNTDLLADALQIANTAWEDNNALQNEAQQRFNTTQSQLNLLGNNVRGVGEVIGQALLPPVNAAIGLIVPLLQDVADLNPLILQLAAGGIAFSAAWGPITTIILPGLVALITGPVGLVVGVAALATVFLRVTGLGDRLSATLQKITADISVMTQGARALLNLVGVAPGEGGNQQPNIEARNNQLLIQREQILKRINELQGKGADAQQRSLRHTVEEGDTLWDLAQQFGTTVEALRDANNLQPGEIFHPGDVFTIPIEADPDSVDAELEKLQSELRGLDAQISVEVDPTSVDSLESQIQAFAQTDFFQRIFGEPDEATVTAFTDTLADIRDEVQGIKEDASQAANGLRLMFAGDWQTGIGLVRQGVQGLHDDLSRIVDTFFGREQTSQPGGTQFDLKNADDMSQGSAIGGLGRRLADSIIGEVQNADITPVQGIMEQHFSTVLRLAGLALGVVFPPAGIVLGVGAALSFAIENDVLGIRTKLEESGVFTTLRNTFEDIKQTVSNIISGGPQVQGPQLPQALAGPFDMAAIINTPQQDESPIAQSVSRLVDGLKRAAGEYTPEIQETINQIGTGISGFINNLSGADTSGFDNIIAFLLNVIGFVGGLVGTIVGLGVDTVSNIFGNTFPELGRVISGIITVVSGIGEGDPSLILKGITDAVTGFANALAGIPVGIGDGILDTIEKLTGLELPDMRTLIEDWGAGIATAFQNVVDSFVGGFDDLAARVDKAKQDLGVGGATGFGSAFFSLGEALRASDGADFNVINDILQSATERGFDVEIFRRQLRNNFGAIMAAFREEIPNLPALTNEELGDLVSTLVNTNALDDAIAALPAPDLTPFLERITQLPPDALDGIDLSNLAQELSDQVEAGTLDADVFKNFILALPEEGLSEEEKQPFIDLADELIAGIADPLNDPENDAVTAMATLAENMEAEFAEATETASPSQMMVRMGTNLIAGLVMGLDQGQPDVGRSVDRLTGEFTRLGNKIGDVMRDAKRSIDDVAAALGALMTGLGALGLPGLPVVPVAQNALGGTFQGFSLVGEQGPEVVFSGVEASVLNNRTSSAFMAGFGLGQRSVGDLGQGQFAATPLPRSISTGSSGAPVVVSFTGDINIVPNPGETVTPEVIQRGLRLYAESNPPQFGDLRNRL